MYHLFQVRPDRPGHRAHLRQDGLHRPAGRVQAEAVQIAELQRAQLPPSQPHSSVWVFWYKLAFSDGVQTKREHLLRSFEGNHENLASLVSEHFDVLSIIKTCATSFDGKKIWEMVQKWTVSSDVSILLYPLTG